MTAPRAAVLLGSERYAGKVKDFDYEAGYARSEDRMDVDGHVYGELSEVVITGSVGVDAQVLYVFSKEVRTPVYQKTIQRVVPNIKACQG